LRGTHAGTILVAAALLGGCLGDGGDASGSAADDATKERLEEAYLTLEAAAEQIPNVRLPPRIGGEIEVVEEGEALHAEAPPKRDTALLDYFGERGIALGLAILVDGQDPGPALSGIEFHDVPQELTLIVPYGLRRGTAGELITGGATFAAISRDGRIYCIDDGGSGVRSCPAPDLPEQ
jgi:hypothetical protein